MHMLSAKGEIVMRIANHFFLILLFGLSAFGLDKHHFDIMETDESAVNSVPVSLARIPYPGWDYVEAANTTLEADLLRTGQFTIGTVNGTHAGILDDEQPLTFGHPLSKTSYALLELDGTLYRLDNYYTDLEMDVNQLSDTRIELICNNGILLTRPWETGAMAGYPFRVFPYQALQFTTMPTSAR
jgi:hypothetical protein